MDISAFLKSNAQSEKLMSQANVRSTTSSFVAHQVWP